jgi:hypothetical protein
VGASALTGPQEERLRALRRDYAAKLPERIRKLAEGVQAVFSDAQGRPPGPRLEELFIRRTGSAARRRSSGSKVVSGPGLGLLLVSRGLTTTGVSRSRA